MSSISVMIVDDQMPMRSILRSLLSRSGYQVIAEAANGAKAIELNRFYKPDVICLDITMPGMDGIETLTKIKQEHPDVMAIMITGHSNRKDIEAAIAAGASGYIVKPIHAGKTLKTLEKLLEKRFSI